jgi:hypothetical protein
MRKQPVILVNSVAAALALAGGVALGYVDLQTSEVIMTLGLMFVFNMVLGAAAPRGGWYWPFLTALGVPLANWFPEVLGLQRNPYLPRTVWSYLALVAMLLIAGVAGMLFGVIVRRSIHAPAA